MRSRWLAAAVVIAGCVSAPPLISLPAPGPSSAGFELVDARTAADIAGSSFGSNYVSTEHLGDSRFTASRIAILRDALERSSGAALKGRIVVVTQFEIFVVHEKRPLIDGPLYGGGGAANLAASLALAGVAVARADRNACATIRIEIATDKYYANACEPTTLADTPRTIAAAMAAAMKKLADEIVSPPR